MNKEDKVKFQAGLELIERGLGLLTSIEKDIIQEENPLTLETIIDEHRAGFSDEISVEYNVNVEIDGDDIVYENSSKEIDISSYLDEFVSELKTKIIDAKQ